MTTIGDDDHGLISFFLCVFGFVYCYLCITIGSFIFVVLNVATWRCILPCYVKMGAVSLDLCVQLKGSNFIWMSG